MQNILEVSFTPADFAALKQRDLSNTVCVVMDVLRATSSMLTALSNGAEAIVPVSEIAEAVEQKKKQPKVLLAGERGGLKIRASQTGGIDFDFGNSPREFVPDAVQGKTIVWTTTNGTRALQACTGAKHIFIASFSNLRAVAAWVQQNKPFHLLLVCAGTVDEAAYEDTMAAGALADLVWQTYVSGFVIDSAQIARQIYLSSRDDLNKAIVLSQNARRLLSNPELREDVPFCLQRETVNFIAEMRHGKIRKMLPPSH